MSERRLLQGWTRWFAWIVVVAASLGLLTIAAVLVLGGERIAALTGLHISGISFNLLWLITQGVALFLAVACLGTLRNSRRMAGLAVLASFMTVGLDVLQSILAFASLHTLQIPLLTPVYLVFAFVLDREITKYDADTARLAGSTTALQGV